MSKAFTADWSKKDKVSLSTMIADSMNPIPLKERLSKTVQRINLVSRKLEDSHVRLEQKYKGLFNKCVRAQESNNNQVAIMYANECSQIRKIAPMVASSQMALEKVALRLETVKDFGDLSAARMPTASVIRVVQDRLKGIIPAVSMNLGQICQSLDTLVLEIGGTMSQNYFTTASSEDADKVLAEASIVAEQKVREGFPELTSPTLKGVNP